MHLVLLRRMWEGPRGESDLKKRIVKLILVVSPRAVEACILKAARA